MLEFSMFQSACSASINAYQFRPALRAEWNRAMSRCGAIFSQEGGLLQPLQKSSRSAAPSNPDAHAGTKPGPQWLLDRAVAATAHLADALAEA
jgi:hypothetical protein